MFSRPIFHQTQERKGVDSPDLTSRLSMSRAAQGLLMPIKRSKGKATRSTYTLCLKNRTPKTGWYNFIKIGQL